MSKKIQDEINQRNKQRVFREFPYGQGDVTKNPQWIKDRDELMNEHGNGWWWELDKEQKIALGIPLTKEERNE